MAQSYATASSALRSLRADPSPNWQAELAKIRQE